MLVLYSVIIILNIYLNFSLQAKIHNVNEIYIIHLKKNTERKKIFMNYLNSQNIKILWFEAVNGKDVIKNYHPEQNIFKQNNRLNPGQIGNFLSHVSVWKDAIKNNYKNIIVLEDDAIIPSDFKKKMDILIKDLKNDINDKWDMVLLGINTGYGKKYNDYLVKLHNTDGNWGTFAYLINVNFIKKHIMSRLVNINLTTDNFLKMFYYDSDFNIFLVNPLIVNHNYNFYSDIFMRKRDNDHDKNTLMIL
uniref:Glycosyltransferase family 25 n=1 Tax=Megaviridae environmental sample TaxID=1737588 RepID=A0A5J6VMM9_9VIRU|nr:MAG: glycosyltransferase family 25 [Megaviridae environmental sample]